MEFAVCITTKTPTAKWDKTEVFPSAEFQPDLRALEARILERPDYMEDDRAHAALYLIDAIDNLGVEAERLRRLLTMVRDREARAQLRRVITVTRSMCAEMRVLLDSRVSAMWAKA